jgi:hypothetical protein
MKLKRKPIAEKYAAEIDALYSASCSSSQFTAGYVRVTLRVTWARCTAPR